MDGSHSKHILDYFLSKFNSLSGIPSSLSSLWSKSRFPWASTEPSWLRFSQIIFLRFLPFQPFLDFCIPLFLEDTLISSWYPKYLFIYDCQPSPHCTFSPDGEDLTRTYTSQVCKRKGRNIGDKDDTPKSSRRNPQQWLYLCLQLWTHCFLLFFHLVSRLNAYCHQILQLIRHRKVSFK